MKCNNQKGTFNFPQNLKKSSDIASNSKLLFYQIEVSNNKKFKLNHIFNGNSHLQGINKSNNRVSGCLLTLP